MIEAVISSTFLILVIIIIRAVFKGKMKCSVRYGLWLIAAVRLMLPFSLFESNVSVMNLAAGFIPETKYEENASLHSDNYADLEPYIPDMPENQGKHEVQTVHVSQTSSADTEEVLPQKTKNISPIKVLDTVRITVTVIMLMWFLTANILFSYALRKKRRQLDISAPIRIYAAENLTSPCIFGLFSPSIYIPEGCSEDSETVEYIIAHELCHYYHGDLIWTVMRYFLLSVYWFDPFVWVAAVLSKRDCECACDEAAIKRLGEEKRFDYGKTIIDLIPRKSGEGFGVASTSMASGKKALKERMKFIVSKPVNRKYALVFSSSVIILAACSAFTSSQTVETEPKDNAITKNTEETEISVTELTEKEDNSISVTVNDINSENRELIFFPAPEGYEPFIYIDKLVPAYENEAYFGDKLENFIAGSHFSVVDASCMGKTINVNRTENKEDFEALVRSLTAVLPEDAEASITGDSCAEVTFYRANGGFSSALRVQIFDTGERKLGVMTGDDFSSLVSLLMSGDIPSEKVIEEAYKSSSRFKSGYFNADELYEYLYILSGAQKRDEIDSLSYEGFSAELFSDNIAERLTVTGEIPKGFVRYETGDIYIGVPYEGSVNEIGSMLLWQNGDMDLRLAAGDRDISKNTDIKKGEFCGQPCSYFEENEKAELVFCDENGNAYWAAVSYKSEAEKETAKKILGSIHIVYRPKPVYSAPVALSAEPSIYGDENYETSRGYGYTYEFCANTAGMLNVSFTLTDKTREYETDFDVHIERLEPDGKWYEVIPLGELIQDNSGYRHFYTNDETGRIPACLDLSCYPLLPEGKYRLVKPYRAVGEAEEKYAALYDFIMSSELTPENELLCTAEVTDKEISADAKEISYNVSGSKAMFVISEHVDIERETNGVWRSVRALPLSVNTSHASFPLAFSGDYTLSTDGFDISQSGRYRLRINYGNCDDDLYVSGNGYNTAYAEFTVK